MTAPPPDLRELLDSVASSAPRFDLADRAIREATARRRRRIAGLTAGAGTLALAAVLVVTLPSDPAAPALAAGGLQYEPNIEVPTSDVDDLPPTLDEAVAFALSGFDSGGALSDDRVVTVSGDVFRIPGSGRWAPMVSPDGSVLVFYDEDQEAVVSRDLRAGTSFTYRSFGPGLESVPQFPQSAYWSPDGHRLAVGSGVSIGESDTVVFDVVTGTEVSLETAGMTLGWTDDDSLLVMRIQQGIDSVPATFVEVDLDGRQHDREGADLEAWSGLSDLSLSPDGSTFAAVSDDNNGSRLVVIDRHHVTQPGYGGTSVRCTGTCAPMLPAAWASDQEIIAAGSDVNGQQRIIAIDVDTTITRDLLTISAAQPYNVTFARDVLQAGARHPLNN